MKGPRRYRPKDGPKCDRMIGVYLTEDEVAQIKRVAAKLGISAWARLVLKKAIET